MLLDDNETLFCQNMKQLSHCRRFDKKKKSFKTSFSQLKKGNEIEN